MKNRLIFPLVIIAIVLFFIETPAYATAGIDAVTVTTNKQGAQT